jgi:hypothetical protein
VPQKKDAKCAKCAKSPPAWDEGVGVWFVCLLRFAPLDPGSLSASVVVGYTDFLYEEGS